MTVPEVRALLTHLLDVRDWNVAAILSWSRWRQDRNCTAAASHRKRRCAELHRRRAAAATERRRRAAGLRQRRERSRVRDPAL
jgi:hypothetical protein